MKISKTTFIFASSCIALCIANSANAEKSGYYIQLNGGMSSSFKSSTSVNGMEDLGGSSVNNKDFDLGKSALIGVEIGKKITDNFRIAIELDYRPTYSYKFKDDSNTVVTKIKTTSTAAMLNLYLDFKLKNKKFVPYLLVGIGKAKNKMKADETSGFDYSISSGSTSGMAYKIGLGGKYVVNKSVDVSAQLQYVDLGKAKFGDTASSLGKTYNINTTKEYRLKAGEILLTVAYKL
jgi:opacity protein-like surface antigen